MARGKTGQINSKVFFAKNHLLQKIGKNVQFHREKKKETRDQFATNAGLGKYFLYRIEFGNANPSIMTLKKIADYLGISIGKLIK
ncbi:transcriptional regulator XRE family [Candidatus Termititenax aidoneus]|uniref:Transcriptional regulator XRE family n=1 Tax=Termititenax aidoneus TaxID=2218524 RepID=A0A388TD83_TERA1|nr:transcriptional regulator XRE family [Candidatus Termititenax aidoneus]